jgi:hypothetical protein
LALSPLKRFLHLQLLFNFFTICSQCLAAAGFEPSTLRSTVEFSDQLSHRRRPSSSVTSSAKIMAVDDKPEDSEEIVVSKTLVEKSEIMFEH